MSAEFGWNFYGFLLYAAVWVSGYLLWAYRANRREREAPSRGSEGED